MTADEVIPPGVQSTAILKTFASENGYSISVPSGWETNATGILGTDVLLYIPTKGAFATDINVMVSAVDPKFSVGGIKAHIQQSMSAMSTNYKKISQQDVTISGAPALHVVSNFDEGSAPYTIYSDEFFVVHAGQLYEFAYKSLLENYQDHYSDFVALMRSVKWTKIQKQ